MGFWDARLSDLEARGVQFSDDEVEILERGGRLLHLHPFENAEMETYSTAERDPSGEVVLTLEVIRAVSPLDRYNASWKTEAHTVAQVLDGDCGRKEWTQWPTYVGVVDMHCPAGYTHGYEHPYLDFRADQLGTYAWWNCIPYDPSMDPALVVLMQAQAERHRHSLWDSYHWVSDLWQNYLDPLDCWLYVNHPEILDASDKDTIRSTIECEWGSSDVENEIKILAEEMHALYSAGVLPFPEEMTVREQRIPNPYEGVSYLGSLPWNPLEFYIPPHEVDAIDLWQRINARRRTGLATIPDGYRHGLYKEEIE